MPELARVFILAVLLIYEAIVFHRIYPGQLIIVALPPRTAHRELVVQASGLYKASAS
jgi:hypothetical protein